MSPGWLPSRLAGAADGAAATAPPPTVDDESRLVSPTAAGTSCGPEVAALRARDDDQGDRTDREQETDGAHATGLRWLAATERPRGIAETPGLARQFREVHSGRGIPASRSSRRSSRCSPRRSTNCPSDDGWLFEPKWDGFRALVFRDGDEVYTQSRDLKPLDRYFPELAAPLRAALPDRCVLDGEVVISRDGALDFEALLLRIHPAESRVRMLAEASPASFVAWDLLALDDEDLRSDAAGGAANAPRRTSSARPSRRSTSHRRLATGRPPPTGSSASRAPALTG